MHTARCLAILLGFFLLLAGAGGANALPIKNGNFAAPKAAKHGERVKPPGFQLQGKVKRVTRFHAAPPHDAALALGNGAALLHEVVLPQPAAPKKQQPAGWYAVASVEVLGTVTSAAATLVATATLSGGAKPLAKAALTPSRKASRGGKTTARGPPAERLWLRIPAKLLASRAGETLTIRLAVSGKGRVVIDDFHFDLFHREPGRALVGKPNGKNGPDLLASGMLGFLALTEHMGTAFSLLEVRKGGPAEKAGLQRSDLVVAVEGTPLAASSLAPGLPWFERSHEATLGRAIERALANSQKHVRLTVLRAHAKGKTVRKDLKVKLPSTTGFADSFPFDDPLATEMRADMIRWIVDNQKPNGSWPGNAEVNSCLAGLALLGTHDRKHRRALRKLSDFLLERNPTAAVTKGFSFWPIAFQGMFLSEYHLATGDKRALAWITDAIEWLPSTTHKCAWKMPAFGHSPKGLPYADKALMAPCAHLLVFEALALRCGVKSKVWDHIKPYVLHSWSDPKKGGHGAMGYNHSAKDKAQFWSRSGLSALALELRGDRKAMRQALVGIMKERHPWMLNSHAYGEPGCALGLMGLAVVDPAGFAEVMPQWRWRFLNAWQPGFGLRYSSPHMGSPYMGEEQIVNPAYGALFSVLNKGLVITGGEGERWLAAR